MMGDEENSPSSEESSQQITSTTLGDNSVSNCTEYFQWQIDTFTTVIEQGTSSLTSSTFHFWTVDLQMKWVLIIFPNGFDMESKDYVSLFLQLKHRESCISNETVMLNLVTANNSLINEAFPHAEIISIGGFECWGYKKFVIRENLLKCKDTFLPNDQLTILCSVTVDIDIQMPGYQLPGSSNPNDTAGLFEASEFSDVVFRVGEDYLYAHKAIIAAKSSVLSSLVTVSENQGNSVVEIPGIDYNVLREVLRFIYTGDAPETTDLTCQLLEAADFFDLPMLKRLCEEAIVYTLTPENLSDMIVLAVAYNTELLRTECFNYFYSHIEEVIERENWQNVLINYPEIVQDLFRYFALRNHN